MAEKPHAAGRLAVANRGEIALRMAQALDSFAHTRDVDHGAY